MKKLFMPVYELAVAPKYWHATENYTLGSGLYRFLNAEHANGNAPHVYALVDIVKPDSAFVSSVVRFIPYGTLSASVMEMQREDKEEVLAVAPVATGYPIADVLRLQKALNIEEPTS